MNRFKNILFIADRDDSLPTALEREPTRLA